MTISDDFGQKQVVVTYEADFLQMDKFFVSFKACETLDEEEMEEGSIGEAKEEEERGELMFGDESGREEEWDDN